MKVSVILCTRNRMSNVLLFLESLFCQTRLPDEIIIVDSSDIPMNKKKKFTERMNAWSDSHYIHTHPGLSFQRNIGIKCCSGKLIFFFDDDVILNNNFLEIIIDTFMNNPDYMGGMGTINGTKTNKLSRQYILQSIFLLQRDAGDGRFSLSGMSKHPYGKNDFAEVEVLGGCLMAYRRELFTVHGFTFDEALIGYSSQEDADFSRRVSRRWKLFFNPKAGLYHNHAPEGRDGIFENRKMYMMNFRYFYFKNFYPYAKWTILAHWWAVIGLFINSFLFKSFEVTKGYAAGMLEFYKRKKELL